MDWDSLLGRMASRVGVGGGVGGGGGGRVGLCGCSGSRGVFGFVVCCWSLLDEEKLTGI